ncbi:IclR family transcriptional regulator [Pseudonocardia lutea]|uniref:IclR family transcriptional regulator n=1 Tax=Pseudonocardia lutea TaxID=2172015 RepID=A0ABW1I1H7_9PSEU
MAGNASVPGASVAQRLFRVLDTFDPAHGEMTLTEIAERADLPISTTRRLLQELTAWGGLERLVDNRFRVGIHLWQIGTLAPRQRDLRETALPLMHDLAKATQETVQVMVLDGLDALCVEKVSAARASPTATQVGGRLPLYATAVGKCLLAHSPRDLLVAVVERGLSRHTPHTLTQPGLLVRQLKEVRAAGVAYSREEMTLGAVSVAAPILSGGTLRGAIGIVVRAPGQLEALTPAVKTASLSIGRVIS